jgi:hypothetical protein
MDGTVIENAASEARPRLGALGKTDTYLWLVWGKYRRRLLFARFRKLRSIEKSWRRIRSLSTDDRKRLGRRFLAGQRTLLRTNEVSSVLYIAIMLLSITSLLIGRPLFHNLVILDVPFNALNAPPPVSALNILLLVFFLLSLILYATKLRALALCLALIFALVFAYYMVSSLARAIKCVGHMDTYTYCHYYLANMIFLALWYLFSLLMVSLVSFGKTILNGRYPEEVISDNLFRIITSLERYPSGVASISLRRTLVKYIEHIALIVRSRLFSQIPAKEPLLIARRKQQAKLISYTIMKRATWLLTPTSRTGEDILSYFGKMMIALLDGTWDDFFDKSAEPADEMMASEIIGKAPTEPPARTGVVVSFLLRVGALIRGVIIAGIPIAAVYLIQRYEINGKPFITIKEPTQNFITAGLVVWSIIVIVSTIDPLFEKRVSALKEIAGILRGGDGSGKK